MPKKRRRKRLNWFSRLFGFNEDAQTYKETQQLLVVDSDTITSKINNKSYKIGHFATEALGEQRARVMKNEKVQQLVGKAHGLVLKIEIGDVTNFHMMPSNRHATFQVCRSYHIHACATCPRIVSHTCLCNLPEGSNKHAHPGCSATQSLNRCAGGLTIQLPRIRRARCDTGRRHYGLRSR